MNICRQNLGTSFEELRVALNEARKEHDRLKAELISLEAIDPKDEQDCQVIETQKIEIGVLQETINVLETALVKAEKDHTDMMNMYNNLNMTQREVSRIQKDLLGLNQKLSIGNKYCDDTRIAMSNEILVG